jgi:replicative DNA helicase
LEINAKKPRNCTDGEPVVFYSAEMNEQDLALWILSAKAQVKVSDFRRGDVEDKMPAALEKIEEIIQSHLYIQDPKGMTAAELQADITRLKIRHSIQAVFFDYLEL